MNFNENECDHCQSLQIINIMKGFNLRLGNHYPINRDQDVDFFPSLSEQL